MARCLILLLYEMGIKYGRLDIKNNKQQIGNCRLHSHNPSSVSLHEISSCLAAFALYNGRLAFESRELSISHCTLRLQTWYNMQAEEMVLQAILSNGNLLISGTNSKSEG